MRAEAIQVAAMAIRFIEDVCAMTDALDAAYAAGMWQYEGRSSDELRAAILELLEWYADPLIRKYRAPLLITFEATIRAEAVATERARYEALVNDMMTALGKHGCWMPSNDDPVSGCGFCRTALASHMALYGP